MTAQSPRPSRAHSRPNRVTDPSIQYARSPARIQRLFLVVVVTSFALISLMFLLMVRVTDPLLPRAVFGVLNTAATRLVKRTL
jgi:hypothetical protein